MVATRSRTLRGLRQTCPTDRWGFYRMDLKILGRWLIELAETHPRAQQVDGRTTIGSFLQRQGIASFSLADVRIKEEPPFVPEAQ